MKDSAINSKSGGIAKIGVEKHASEKLIASGGNLVLQIFNLHKQTLHFNPWEVLKKIWDIYGILL